LDHIDFLDIASKFGVPVLILLAIWKAGAKIVPWVGTEMIIPMRDSVIGTVTTVGSRAIKYLDDNLLWMRALGNKLEQMADENSRHHAWEEERLDEMHRNLAEMGHSKGFNWADPKENSPVHKPPSDPKKTGLAPP
jgi:hypothetical protein